MGTKCVLERLLKKKKIKDALLNHGQYLQRKEQLFLVFFPVLKNPQG